MKISKKGKIKVENSDALSLPVCLMTKIFTIKVAATDTLDFVH
jgi:hypothetical protein